METRFRQAFAQLTAYNSLPVRAWLGCLLMQLQPSCSGQGLLFWVTLSVRWSWRRFGFLLHKRAECVAGPLETAFLQLQPKESRITDEASPPSRGTQGRYDWTAGVDPKMVKPVICSALTRKKSAKKQIPPLPHAHTSGDFPANSDLLWLLGPSCYVRSANFSV